MGSEVFGAMDETRDFLFDRVYLGRVTALTAAAVGEILAWLLEHFSRHPIPLSESSAGSNPPEDPRVSAVDYVAGMTDRFALRSYEALSGSPAPDLGALG